MILSRLKTNKPECLQQTLESRRSCKITIDIVKIEYIRMTQMLNSLMCLHPFTPSIHHPSSLFQRESRTSITTRTTSHIYSHISLMKRGLGNLAINSSEMTRFLVEQIITRCYGLGLIPHLSHTCLGLPSERGSVR